MIAALLALATLLGFPEGRPVAAVRIAAPATRAAGLARYVEIAPGQPLTSEAVRHAVELIHATGEYEDVVVEAEDTAAGLEVVFRPVPAPLLAAVVVEGDRVLSPRGVRRAARLRAGEPLWSERLDAAAQAVALALAADGYLEARVSAAARRRDGGADAVFTLQAGPRVRVSSVALEGAAPAEARALLGLLAPRPGAPFARARAREAAERVRRRLVAGGRWRATVEPREIYDPAAARVALVFEAAPGPLLRLEFRGEELPGRLREAVRDALREGAVKADALDEAAERIENELRRRGFREPRVSQGVEARPGAEAVVYEIAAGEAARAGRVRVPGVDDPALVLLPDTREGEPLLDAVVEADARRLTRALEQRGHAEARVEAELRDGGGEIPVTFRVQPGPRTLVRGFELDAPAEGVAAPQELKTRMGRPYRGADLAEDASALASAYRNAGYLQAEVVPELAFSEDRSEVAVALRVAPGPRTSVEHVVVAGLRRTRESVVRRELLVKEGDPLGLRGVLESQRRLGVLGVFQRVNLAELDPESVARRSLVVAVEEAPRTSIAYAVGYSERDRLRASVELTQRNLAGLDRTLSGYVRASFRGNRALATYREPYLFGRQRSLFLTAFREEDDRDSFDFIRSGGLLQTVFSLRPGRSLILRYSYQDTRTFNVEVPLTALDRQFQESTFSGPSSSLFEDTRDDPLDPRRGHFVGADVQLSLAALGGDGFVKGFLQAAGYRTLTSRAVLAASARLGLSRSFGTAEPVRLPLPDRFYAGGDYSLRGFATDAVAPEGGNALLLGGLELRLDATRYVSLALFSELGNVYPFVRDVALDELRYTVGLGLRYKSALGPLRLDWGYKLNRRPGESPSHLHITIGHAF